MRSHSLMDCSSHISPCFTGVIHNSRDSNIMTSEVEVSACSCELNWKKLIKFAAEYHVECLVKCILQAQARCHRIGQSKAVKIYRLITRNSYEREMFDKASLKLGLDKAVLQSMSGRENTTSGVRGIYLRHNILILHSNWQDFFFGFWFRSSSCPRRRLRTFWEREHMEL